MKSILAIVTLIVACSVAIGHETIIETFSIAYPEVPTVLVQAFPVQYQPEINSDGYLPISQIYNVSDQKYCSVASCYKNLGD